MTGKAKNPKTEELDRLAEVLIENLIQASDEEILAEAREDYGDLEKAIQDIDAVWERASIQVGKRRLQTAKEELTRSRTVMPAPHAEVIDITRARKLLAKLTQQSTSNNEVPITLAARNLSDLSDEEVLSILDDLRELGALQDDGDDL